VAGKPIGTKVLAEEEQEAEDRHDDGEGDFGGGRFGADVDLHAVFPLVANRRLVGALKYIDSIEY
jgi:hypothetical protein